ncbi:hypothetical protein PHAVU_003G116500 [Phaseolus vulgaris]|uniref:Pectinesterase inhibitor domain-containing protein n=1 Tax=Phaseolus vulgaris TaxID=3885 RepID=V7CBW4_PHAVU|nr:hypothetical protein PHAVU_003G116500g [Phaseolus vulgaris]ESW26396.1 hypothetical protein PHAVU_003G116500g [Phaseolus vulgaris]
MIFTSSSTFILIQLVTSLIFLITPILSILTHAGLLEQICHQSPNYHLCVMTLRSSIHHRSREDMAGFARLTLEIVNSNSSTTLEHIHKSYGETTNPKVKKALEYCLVSYNTIVDVHLREALDAMKESNYKIAQQKIYVIIIEVESCNNKFKNLVISPLRNTNRYVQNLCSITISIINNLIQPYQPISTY